MIQVSILDRTGKRALEDWGVFQLECNIELSIIRIIEKCYKLLFRIL
jgi:hypothetical protein